MHNVEVMIGFFVCSSYLQVPIAASRISHVLQLYLKVIMLDEKPFRILKSVLVRVVRCEKAGSWTNISGLLFLGVVFLF